MITCPHCNASAGRAYLSASHRWQHDCQTCGKTSRAKVVTENEKTVIIKLSATGPRKRCEDETYTFLPRKGQRAWLDANGGAETLRLLIDSAMSK